MIGLPGFAEFICKETRMDLDSFETIYGHDRLERYRKAYVAGM